MTSELVLLRIDVPGKPQPKQRPRVARGRAYTPPETVAYEEAIGWAFREQNGGTVPLEGPLRVYVLVREDVRPVPRQGDCDNYAKVALDALNKLAWNDDKQVLELLTYVRRMSGEPGMVIEIEQLPE